MPYFVNVFNNDFKMFISSFHLVVIMYLKKFLECVKNNYFKSLKHFRKMILKSLFVEF